MKVKQFVLVEREKLLAILNDKVLLDKASEHGVDNWQGWGEWYSEGWNQEEESKTLLEEITVGTYEEIITEEK